MFTRKIDRINHLNHSLTDPLSVTSNIFSRVLNDEEESLAENEQLKDGKSLFLQ